ncbi:MAG: 6-bladed beta-propeller [Thermoanaerobaculia bacterium]
MNRAGGTQRQLARVAGFLIAISAWIGMAGLGAAESTAPLVWPAPPAVPRIEFVQVISAPEDLDIGSGIWRKLRRALKGSNEPRRIVRPHGMAKDSAGRLYVVDASYRAVHVFDPVKSTYTRFPKEPIRGFSNPIGVAVDDEGRIFVSDSQSGVVHVFRDRGSVYVRALGEEVFERPTGIALDRSTGELLVLDSLASQLVAFDAATLRQKVVLGADGTAAGEFHFPTSVAVSTEGRLHVVDSLNFRVQVLASDRKFLFAFGAPGDGPGYFSRPKGVAVDSDGNIYVVDALFDNVQVFDREGRLLLAFGGPGQAAGQFWLPSEILIDKTDRIYVADTYNERIQVFQYLKQDAKR